MQKYLCDLKQLAKAAGPDKRERSPEDALRGRAVPHSDQVFRRASEVPENHRKYQAHYAAVNLDDALFLLAGASSSRGHHLIGVCVDCRPAFMMLGLVRTDRRRLHAIDLPPVFSSKDGWKVEGKVYGVVIPEPSSAGSSPIRSRSRCRAAMPKRSCRRSTRSMRSISLSNSDHAYDHMMFLPRGQRKLKAAAIVETTSHGASVWDFADERGAVPTATRRGRRGVLPGPAGADATGSQRR